MPRSSPAAKKATAYHESGHAIMCWKLGVALKKVTIVPNTDTSRSCHYDMLVRGRCPEMDSSASTQLKMEKLAMIALAGPTHSAFTPHVAFAITTHLPTTEMRWTSRK